MARAQTEPAFLTQADLVSLRNIEFDHGRAEDIEVVEENEEIDLSHSRE